MLNPRRRYHRAEIRSVERLPAGGAAVIVSNHGRLDLDCFILAGLILRSQGRVVRLMADHLWFKVPGVRRLWSWAGAVDGTQENAAALLTAGELILAYPGGVRELMGGRLRREYLDWHGRTGFARAAIAAGVPVIPVAGIGVNSGHIFLTSGRVLGRLLFQRILRMGPAYNDYRDPLTIGVLPIPLPFSLAVHLPLPCKVRYFVGEPIQPPVDVPAARGGAAAEKDWGSPDDSAAVEDFAARVVAALRALIEEHGRP